MSANGIRSVSSGTFHGRIALVSLEKLPIFFPRSFISAGIDTRSYFPTPSTVLTSHPRRHKVIFAMAAAAERATQSNALSDSKTLLCTSLTASTVSGMLSEAKEAVAASADIVELRLDYLQDFNPEKDLKMLLDNCPLPSVVTYRPHWEG